MSDPERPSFQLSQFREELLRVLAPSHATKFREIPIVNRQELMWGFLEACLREIRNAQQTIEWVIDENSSFSREEVLDAINQTEQERIKRLITLCEQLSGELPQDFSEARKNQAKEVFLLALNKLNSDMGQFIAKFSSR